MVNTFYKHWKTAAAALIIALSSCNNQDVMRNTASQAQGSGCQAPKYIFYFVGDGMSQPQISMAEKAISEEAFRQQFNAQTCNIYNHQGGALNLRKFESIGMATTNAENRFITCSAAAATALATGHKTTINTISMNGDRTERLESVAEMAKKNGKKVAVISSVSIDHATPACFYAHTEDRNNYEAIGKWLLSSGFDYFGGGFTRWDTYKGMSRDQFMDSLRTLGYTITTTRKDFDALNANSGKVLATVAKNIEGVHDGSSLPYNIDLDEQDGDDNRIVLRDFLSKAIELTYNDNEGFLIFCEGGKIDWADHANDAVSNVYETIALDQAIGVAMDFYAQHPNETLIVFTGDHECGGLTLGFAGTKYESAFHLMQGQSRSHEEFSQYMREFVHTHSFDEVLQELNKNFGLGGDGELKLTDYEKKRLKEAYLVSRGDKKASISEEEQRLFYGYYEPITVTATTILDNKCGVEWASFAHTALPVPVYSIGCGSQLLSGYFDNTDIPNTIMKVCGWK